MRNSTILWRTGWWFSETRLRSVAGGCRERDVSDNRLARGRQANARSAATCAVPLSQYLRGGAPASATALRHLEQIKQLMSGHNTPTDSATLASTHRNRREPSSAAAPYMQVVLALTAQPSVTSPGGVGPEHVTEYQDLAGLEGHAAADRPCAGDHQRPRPRHPRRTHILGGSTCSNRAANTGIRWESLITA